MNFYTGIGSRETPIIFIPLIKGIAETMNKLGYTLRSGGAPGADLFFEEYANSCEIYLPWQGFNGSNSELFNISEAAMLMAKQYHPAWDKLSQAAQKLMARNCYQIMGEDLMTPTEFVVCYTTDGKASGGTGQAMRIAKAYNIPVVNLYHKSHVERLRGYLGRRLKGIPEKV